MAKRYIFITRSTGNIAKIAGRDTREAAREVKRNKNFRVAIYDTWNDQFVR